jgi:hypothetical protein
MSIIINSETTPLDFFRNLVKKAWGRQSLPDIPNESDYLLAQQYLIFLLMEYVRDDAKVLTRPPRFSELYTHLHTGGPFIKIQEVGDVSLLAASIFTARDHRSRRLFSNAAFCELAASAYQALYQRSARIAEKGSVFKPLAEQTPVFVRVLAEVARELGYDPKKRVTNLVRTWKRYVKYGDQEDLRILRECGVHMLPEGEKMH